MQIVIVGNDWEGAVSEPFLNKFICFCSVLQLPWIVLFSPPCVSMLFNVSVTSKNTGQKGTVAFILVLPPLLAKRNLQTGVTTTDKVANCLEEKMFCEALTVEAFMAGGRYINW